MIMKATFSNTAHPEYGAATIPFPIPGSEYDHTIKLLGAMASKLCLSDIKDFINLTFCCQQAAVITDFSDLERIGKAHSRTINGGSMLKEEFDKVDGQAVALDLIQSGTGVVTPYGVVFDNGMELEQLYDGQHCAEPSPRWLPQRRRNWRQRQRWPSQRK